MDFQLSDPHLRRFAAVVVHELRTPLSALSGEVEIALRRERSPAACREMLERVGALVAELTDLTRDLAIYADLVHAELLRPATSRLSDCLDVVARRHPNLVACSVDGATGARRVVGDQSLLTRALILLLDHAVRHRPSDAPIRLSSVPRVGAGAIDDSLVLIVEASPGFPPQVWAPLAGDTEQPPVEQAAMFRLPTVARIVAGCGGSIDVQCSAGAAAVRIELLPARP